MGIDGLLTKTKQQLISSGIEHFDRITQPPHQLNPDDLLKHQKARPEQVLGSPEAAKSDAGLTDAPQ